METLGPVDYIVVGFRGNNFDGSILDELSKAVKSGTIRIIDLVFIIKDEDGHIIEGEYEDQSEDIKSIFRDLSYADDTPLFTEDDVQEVGKSMDNNTAAGVLVLEHVWARGLKRALLDAGGMLVAEGRIHPEKVEAALHDMESA